MRYRFNLALAAIFLVASSVAAFAGNVRTDYDHSVNFAQYHTYSWGKVQTSIPFYASRIKQAVDKDLQSKGWQLAESGGSVMIFATDNVHDHQQLQTMYDGMGGGWGAGWGWGGWGWGDGWGPGMGESTTTTTNQHVGDLVIDMFDATSKKLLWRGVATQDLSTNASKNTKSLDGDINNMFKKFPPKP
jgi:hypothetical protein